MEHGLRHGRTAGGDDGGRLAAAQRRAPEPEGEGAGRHGSLVDLPRAPLVIKGRLHRTSSVRVKVELRSGRYICAPPKALREPRIAHFQEAEPRNYCWGLRGLRGEADWSGETCSTPDISVISILNAQPTIRNGAPPEFAIPAERKAFAGGVRTRARGHRPRHRHAPRCDGR